MLNANILVVRINKAGISFSNNIFIKRLMS